MRRGTENPQRRYRQGVLLGFTLSEVMTLLAAALLLALAINMAKVVHDRDKARQDAETCQKELGLAPDCAAQLAEVAKRLNVPPSPENIDDMFTELRLTQERAEKWNRMLQDSGLSEMQIAERLQAPPETKEQRELDKARAAKWEKIKSAIPGITDASLSEHAKEIANLIAGTPGTENCETKLGQCDKHLSDAKNVADYWVQKAQEKAGRGGLDYPPCWRVPESNKPLYIFEVDIADDGLTVKDLSGDRRHELEEIGLDPTLFAGKQTLAAFSSKTRGILNNSKASNCRHFVRVTDSTTTKMAYKSMLQVVEGSFYKYEIQTAPPQQAPPPTTATTAVQFSGPQVQPTAIPTATRSE